MHWQTLQAYKKYKKSTFVRKMFLHIHLFRKLFLNVKVHNCKQYHQMYTNVPGKQAEGNAADEQAKESRTENLNETLLPNTMARFVILPPVKLTQFPWPIIFSK